MNRYLLRKIKKIEFRDFKDFFVFLSAMPLSLLFRFYNKLKKKKIWIICEDEIGANDNGYVFFEYMCKKHKDIDCYYVIDFNSKLYGRIKDLGNSINWGSYRHWIYYLAANVIISTQMGTAPNRHVVFSLEIMGIINNNRVFLQHGITLNYYPSLDYFNNKLRLIICGAKPEYDYVKSKFHFPDGHVAYTGFARFDKLFDCVTNKKLILIMPTWRSWIVNDKEMSIERFLSTQFYLKYQSVLNNNKLLDYIEQKGYKVVFYLHRAMQEYVDAFFSRSENVEIVKRFDKDIQMLLKEGALLITDYSSVSMDFAYMKKPIVYFQFDEARFRKEHGSEGYFSYRKNGFGPVIVDEKEICDSIIRICESECVMQKEYSENADNFYSIHDNCNCERIYREISIILHN